MRQVRALEECSVQRCVAFLEGIKDEAMRLHLAAMAWWRFSVDDKGAAGPLLELAKNARAEVPDSGASYMHRALRTLSPLTHSQLSAWFGCDNLYQLVDVFVGDRPQVVGKHCTRCGLYKQGCTAYSTLGADNCHLWRDEFVQKVAAVIAKAGRWHNPCRGIDQTKRGQK